MKKRLVIFVFCIISITCLAQHDMNFAPKQLTKEIKNTYQCEHAVLIRLNDSLVLDSLHESYYKIGHCQQQTGYVFIGRVKTCRAGVCSLSDKFNNEFYEYFDYFILFDSTATVRAVKIFNYEASHGHEITVKKWLNQFIGFDGSYELVVGKNVDAISGATISVHSITYDISLRTSILKQYISALSQTQQISNPYVQQ